jgi:hypothetical protein
MKKMIFGAFVLGLAFIAMPALTRAATTWDTTGSYVVSFEYLGGFYDHDVSLVQDGSDMLTGSGGHPAGGPHVYTWVLTSGSVVGDTITFTADYTASADAVVPQTTMNVTGTIAPDGTMSGTWTDNYQGGARAGTWETTSGAAVEDADGPVTSDVAVSGTTLTANVDDTTTGGSLIDSAEYSLNGGAWTNMNASDSSFDEIEEDVTAALGALGGGIYNVCVRGTDVADNTGDAACTTFTVEAPASVVSGGGSLYGKGGKKTWTFGSDITLAVDGEAGGHLTIVNHTTKVTCNLDEISGLSISGNTATFTASGDCNDSSSKTGLFTIVDNGEPGTGDTITVSGGFTIATTLLGGGNFQVNDTAPAGTYTLYADGSTSCPGADDLSDPDGSVLLTPKPGAVDYTINLVGAEPNRLYSVAISQEPSCSAAYFDAVTFTTDSNGDATHSGTYTVASGAYNLLVNIYTDAGGLSDAKHREISTTDAFVFVP